MAKRALEHANIENRQNAVESCQVLGWERDADAYEDLPFIRLCTRRIQNRVIRKVYPKNSQLIIVPEFQDLSLRRLQLWLGNPRAVSNHYLEEPGVRDNPVIDRRARCSLWKRLPDRDWKTTESPSVLLGTTLLGEYIFGNHIKWSDADDLCTQLLEDYGVSER